MDRRIRVLALALLLAVALAGCGGRKPAQSGATAEPVATAEPTATVQVMEPTATVEPTATAQAAAAPGVAYGGGSVALFATNVGKGDALLLVVDGWAGLIDTGKPRARGRVLSAMAAMGVTALDAVFITHTDNDHTGGLGWLADSDIPVGAWYASGYFTGVKPEKHDAVKAAAKRGQEVNWLRRGDTVPLGATGALLRTEDGEDKQMSILD